MARDQAERAARPPVARGPLALRLRFARLAGGLSPRCGHAIEVIGVDSGATRILVEDRTGAAVHLVDIKKLGPTRVFGGRTKILFDLPGLDRAREEEVRRRREGGRDTVQTPCEGAGIEARCRIDSPCGYEHRCECACARRGVERAFDAGHQGPEGGVRRERDRAGRRLYEHQGQGVHVGPVVESLTPRLLGRGVARRAHHGARRARSTWPRPAPGPGRSRLPVPGPRRRRSGWRALCPGGRSPGGGRSRGPGPRRRLPRRPGRGTAACPRSSIAAQAAPLRAAP